MYRKGNEWQRAKIIKKASTPRSIISKNKLNQIIRRNTNHF